MKAMSRFAHPLILNWDWIRPTDFGTLVYLVYSVCSTCKFRRKLQHDVIWHTNWPMCCLFTDCDLNCASGCTTRGPNYCDSMCISNYYLTPSFTCSRELVSHFLVTIKWYQILCGPIPLRALGYFLFDFLLSHSNNAIWRPLKCIF